MNNELLAMVERDVLDWPGVSKETHRGGPGQGGFWVPPATVYKFGRRALGEIHDQLISDGWAKQHGGGFAGVVSYHIRELEDVPEVVELFRMNYERAKGSAERRRKA